MTVRLQPADIRRLRLALGMQQSEFGRLLRAHPTTVSRWEAQQQVVVPDDWQNSVMLSLQEVVRRQPTAGEQAIRFIAAGAIGAALGALFGALAEKSTAPNPARRQQPRVRRPKAKKSRSRSRARS